MSETIPGMQTRGVMCLQCTITDTHIDVVLMYVRDSEKLGQQVDLVETVGDRHFPVMLPSEAAFPEKNVRLERCQPSA